MDGKWNERLKECRERKGFSLKDLEGFNKLDTSQQSLIKYEKGEVYPRIDLLEKMCREYETTIDYILYGDKQIISTEKRNDSLTVLFMLLYSEKIEYIETQKSLIVKEEKLERQIRALNQFKQKSDISSLDDLFTLAKAIKKLEDI